MNMITSMYGIFFPMLKPESWRLYDWLSIDFYRKVPTMTRLALVIELGKSVHKLYTVGKTYNTDEKEFAC